ncbi:MAG: YggL family protein [Gammaproteobacteria bacterium]|nr:YggL family protein [Gammaproteobacteria bacterium]
MKENAKRNTRLRKKLRVDEFQELGFEVTWAFAKGTNDQQIDQMVDKLINDVIEVNKLGFAGGGDLVWEGLVCTQQLGQCTDEHRSAVQAFLEANGATDIEVTPLFDLWWG